MAHKLAHRRQSTGDDPPGIDPKAQDFDPDASDVDPNASDVDPNASDVDPDASEIDRNGSGSSHITRRGYVRLGGSTIATVAAIVGWGSGVAAVADESDDRNHLIQIHGSGTPSVYEVTVDGELVPEGGPSRAAGHVSGSTAEGAVVGGDRGYRFRGELYDVTVDGDAEVSLDGEVIGH